MKGETNHKHLKDIFGKGKRSSMPENVKPMLATLVDEPFDDPDWMYEVKWDGYRALSYIYRGRADILSRNNKSFNDKYYPLRELLSEWKTDAVIDGESRGIDLQKTVKKAQSIFHQQEH